MHKLYPRTAQSVDDPLAEIQKLVHSLPEEPEDEIQTPLIALIVRAILHKLDFIEMINEIVPWDRAQCRLSPGHRALALILLPFISENQRVALVNAQDSFANYDMELIFDAPLDPSALNDDCLRRFLDQFAKACPEDFFNQLALKCYAVFDLPRSTLLHGDTTSHEVCGEYEEEEGIPHLGPTICAGYNKTGRKDRKIFQSGVVSDGNGLIRHCTIMDGNNADCQWNMDALKFLKTLYGPEFNEYTYIADAKLLTKPNMEVMNRPGSEVRFISRVPSSFAENLAAKHRSLAYERNNWTNLGRCCDAEDQKVPRAVYRSQRFDVDVFGQPCNLIVYESSAADEKVADQLRADEKELKNTITQRFKDSFACDADARKAIGEFEGEFTKLLLNPKFEVVPENITRWPRGRRGKDTKPLEEHTVYYVRQTGLIPDEKRVIEFKRKKETFVLLTNVPCSDMDDKAVLKHYKQQSVVEYIFRLMKMSVMADRIYLNDPARIKALMTILYISYLVMGIIQAVSRKKVIELPEPPRIYIDDKPLKSPTAAFLITSLRHFSVVTAQGSRRIVGTAHQLRTRLPILLFLLDMNQL